MYHSNAAGQVDFECMDIGKGDGVYEGIILANVVSNISSFSDELRAWKPSIPVLCGSCRDTGCLVLQCGSE